jgi:hypothetical protein
MVLQVLCQPLSGRGNALAGAAAALQHQQVNPQAGAAAALQHQQVNPQAGAAAALQHQQVNPQAGAAAALQHQQVNPQAGAAAALQHQQVNPLAGAAAALLSTSSPRPFERTRMGTWIATTRPHRVRRRRRARPRLCERSSTSAR